MTRWTIWRKDVYDGDPDFVMAVRANGSRAVRNNVYRVLVRYCNAPLTESFFDRAGSFTHLVITRVDRKPVHRWRDLQRIKTELVGADVEAIEIYPAESRLVDLRNVYHLWCFHGLTFPWGPTGRYVK
jgi:hypothetical protein